MKTKKTKIAKNLDFKEDKFILVKSGKFVKSVKLGKSFIFHSPFSILN